ncbi:RNA polymerase sigma factor [Bacillus massiliigorillae]|uniref:RNA polymerase sigma factor n=1 Tax=Bacillus massiliigorillae TaxID=1243664 RepID=UPI00039EE784|nr:RNA polymerase sigma factor [Bacillus massiliigorillae]
MVDLDNLENSIIRIYNSYYKDVYRFLICFSGNQNDAEDMTQEVFIRVLNNLSNYNSSQNLKTWVFSIAKHVAIDHYRKNRLVSILKKGFFNQMKAIELDPNEVIEQNEIKNLVHEAIAKLKPHYRIIVILRGINEFSIKETSRILQCSESKVKVTYHRALKELKRKINIDAEGVISNAN